MQDAPAHISQNAGAAAPIGAMSATILQAAPT
jgi:hypothetical protein